jgi:uncharacterized membrane protein
MPLLELVLWLHILAAVTWIGGMIFLTLIVVPVEKKIQDSKLRYELVNKIGIRFKYLGWGSMLMLVITGTYSALQKVHSWSELINTGYGRTLLLKLVLVFLMFSLSILHDFYLGPKLVQRGIKGGKITNLASIVALLARGNLLLGLIVILLAVSLRFGGL